MDRRVEHALVGLADGTLDERERERATALLDSTEGAPAALAAQQRARSALQTFSAIDAPPALREGVAVRAPRRRRGPAAALVLAGAAAVVLFFALAGAPDSPSLTTLAAASERPATGPAPAPRGDALLSHEFAGVTFPDWERELGWKAQGQRTDRVAGRRAETVFYTHQGHRIGYTVLEGEAYAPLSGGREYEVDGTTVRVFTPPGAMTHPGAHGPVSARVAVFERNGRTCVLSGEVLDERTLVELAGWKGSGAVEF